MELRSGADRHPRFHDHGIWQGSSVFDGARMFDGLIPDLDAHCARTNRSAEALMITLV